MVLLCSQHHHLVHEGGWILTIREHLVVLTSPDGTKTLVEAPAVRGRPRELAEIVPACIDGLTLTGGQTGDRLDLDYATSVIATDIQLTEQRADQERRRREETIARDAS
jgi:hypothetical protein